MYWERGGDDALGKTVSVVEGGRDGWMIVVLCF